MDKQAYLAGYMCKHAAGPAEAGALAWVGGKLVDLTSGMLSTGKTFLETTLPKAVDKAEYVALGLPLLAGGTAGYLASKLTSPSEQDKTNIQRKLVLEELNQALAEKERRRAKEIAEDIASQDEKDTASKRELHI